MRNGNVAHIVHSDTRSEPMRALIREVTFQALTRVKPIAIRQGVTANEIALRVGITSDSTRRYLNEMVNLGELVVDRAMDLQGGTGTAVYSRPRGDRP